MYPYTFPFNCTHPQRCLHTDDQSTTTLVCSRLTKISACSAETAVDSANGGGGAVTIPAADTVLFTSACNQVGHAHASSMSTELATNRKTSFHVVRFSGDNCVCDVIHTRAEAAIKGCWFGYVSHVNGSVHIATIKGGGVGMGTCTMDGRVSVARSQHCARTLYADGID